MSAVHLLNLHARGNVGDASLVESALGLLEEHWPGVAVTAATRYREDDAWLAELGARPVAPAVSFPQPGRGPDALRALRFLGSAGMAGARVATGAPSPARSSGWRPLVNADLALSAGGGYLFSRPGRPFTLLHVLAELRCASAFVPTVLLPQSIGPVTTPADRRRFRRALGGVALLMVRERQSLHVAIEELGLPEERVVLAPDLVFVLAGPVRTTPVGTAPRIGLTVLDWRWAGGDDTAYEHYLDQLARAADSLIADGCSLDLLVQVQITGHTRQDDGLVARRLRERLRLPDKTRVRPVGTTSGEALRTYGALDLVIGSRLHSALLALCAGTPALTLGYQPKAAGIYEELGLGEWALDARDLDANDLVARARALLDGRDDARAQVRAAVDGARSRLHASVAEGLRPWLGPSRRATIAVANDLAEPR